MRSTDARGLGGAAGGLQFASRDDALAYLDTDEHETLTDLLLGIRIR